MKINFATGAIIVVKIYELPLVPSSIRIGWQGNRFMDREKLLMTSTGPVTHHKPSWMKESENLICFARVGFWCFPHLSAIKIIDIPALWPNESDANCYTSRRIVDAAVKVIIMPEQ
jgi:hypothetical protein